jgi:hypothetical protein
MDDERVRLIVLEELRKAGLIGLPNTPIGGGTSAA